MSQITSRQISLPGFCPLNKAVKDLSLSTPEGRGAIFTRREVVDFILDLVGYTADKPLHLIRFLEPSFGNGDFLIPAVERLLAAWKQAGYPDPLRSLSNSIRAVELHKETFNITRERLLNLLSAYEFSNSVARELIQKWLLNGDFLLADIEGQFEVVVGNPPYVRQELIPDVLIAEYRARYKTIYDRADLYVPFIERSLMSLSPKGSLGFICADRWLKNRYGERLRELVASKYHLRVYVDMVDTPAFYANVSAYPAITIITRDTPGPTRIARRPIINREYLAELALALTQENLPEVKGTVREMHGVASGSAPWLFDPSEQIQLLRRLEKEYPLLEEAGCKVGIGVATGADQVFIAPFESLDVEEDRKLPLVTTRDIVGGGIAWQGLGIINPFDEDGQLVNLACYPRLATYLEHYKEVILKRHVAQKNPAKWYRTIDRIYSNLAEKPKLLIPDIRGEAHVVFENGQLYPHHNLYFITSESWDLHALQAVLLSNVARFFVSTYSTKIRGGYLRFQAQYLRRIRLPHWADVSPDLREHLKQAGLKRDLKACNQAVVTLFNLTDQETILLEGTCV